MTKDEFALMLKEVLQEKLQITMERKDSYGAGPILELHVTFDSETILTQEVYLD